MKNLKSLLADVAQTLEMIGDDRSLCMKEAQTYSAEDYSKIRHCIQSAKTCVVTAYEIMENSKPIVKGG